VQALVINAGGIQLVGWLMGAEMFPLAARGKASSVHAATLWGANLIITSSALSMVSHLGTGGAMWISAGPILSCFLVLWKDIPKTTGHTLEDIEKHLLPGASDPCA
jgi:hypothetical protein